MININPIPIFLSLGPVQIHWYGFLIFLAFWLGFFIASKRAKKYDLSKEQVYDLAFWLFLTGLIGARLYHVFSELSYYWQNPEEIIFFWQGGLGIYGAIVTGFLVLLFWAKKNKPRTFKQGIKSRQKNSILPLTTSGQVQVTEYSKVRDKKSFLSLLDFLSPLIILGLAIGRWGNFFNQELYGLPTNQTWGLFISPENRLLGYENFSFFHPTFFYESIFCFLLFIFLLIQDQKKKINGQIFFWMIFLYSIFRFFNEFIRIDPQPLLFFWRLGNWSSLSLLIFSVLFIFFIRKKEIE